MDNMSKIKMRIASGRERIIADRFEGQNIIEMARASTLYDKKIILTTVRENEARSKRFRDLANDTMLNQNSKDYLERIAEKEREADNVDDVTKELEK